MRAFLRRALGRLGLTGKLLLHVGWILSLSVVLLVLVLHLRATAVVRGELRTMEMIRIDRWASAHLAAIQADDRWKMAEALETLSRDPYVVYAGLFDRGGNPVAQTGDEGAYRAAHTLDLIVSLRAGPGGGVSEAIAGGLVQPLPGLAPDPRRAARAVPFSERFSDVLADEGKRSQNLLGWVEVTLDTAPLDALVRGVVRQLAAIGAALVICGLLVTWYLSVRITGPLRDLRESAALIAAGRLDEPFENVERPADEVGDLATQFSIMAARLRRERERVALLAHDLKTPLTSIRAFSEILLDGGEADPAERARFLGTIRDEAERMAVRIDDLARADSGPEGRLPGDGRRRILVASGDASLRSLLRDAIAGEGTEVVEAAGASAALSAARQETPDAVVLDLLMPGGEAFPALGDLARKTREGRPTVLTLGVLRAGDSLHSGAVFFHPKPLDRESFLKSVREATVTAPPGPPKVLIADDDRFVAEAVRSLLQREGFEVSVAAGGEACLVSAFASPPDLIVIDLTMPDLDGIAVVKRLRGNPATHDRPVILMTAHAIPDGAAMAWPAASVTREAFASGVRSALQQAMRP